MRADTCEHGFIGQCAHCRSVLERRAERRLLDAQESQHLVFRQRTQRCAAIARVLLTEPQERVSAILTRLDDTTLHRLEAELDL